MCGCSDWVTISALRNRFAVRWSTTSSVARPIPPMMNQGFSGYRLPKADDAPFQPRRQDCNDRNAAATSF